MSKDEKTKTFRGPQKLTTPLTSLVEPVFAARQSAEGRLIVDWVQIVGSETAAMCYPVKLSFAQGKGTGGTLLLAVTGAYATVLQHRIPQLRERIAMYFGFLLVDRITLEQAAPGADARKKPAARKPTAQKGDMACVSAVEDEELRRALEKLGNTLGSDTVG